MIELILREAVPSLGKAGDMVRVKPGYARNFLLPRGLAFEATEGNKKRILAEARSREAKQAADRAEATAFAAKLAAVTVELTSKAGEEGKLFGSVTSADIADALAALGLVVDKRRIELEHPLRMLGFHAVAVRLQHDVQAEVKVNISPEG